MADTHLVVYDNSSAHVHGIFALSATGAWSNSGTYVADGYIQCATAGKIVDGLGTNTRCFAVDTPTFDDTDFQGFGAFEVDDTVTPTDVQERSDGDRIPDGVGGKDGDLPDYTYT